MLVLGKTATRAADAILAAGYSKARTIDTVEELEALPAGTIVMDAEPDALLRTDTGSWRSLMDPDYTFPSRSLILPAKVVHEPEGQ
jgi:hypothetical protein